MNNNKLSRQSEALILQPSVCVLNVLGHLLTWLFSAGFHLHALKMNNHYAYTQHFTTKSMTQQVRVCMCVCKSVWCFILVIPLSFLCEHFIAQHTIMFLKGCPHCAELFI